MDLFVYTGMETRPEFIPFGDIEWEPSNRLLSAAFIPGFEDNISPAIQTFEVERNGHGYRILNGEKVEKPSIFVEFGGADREPTSVLYMSKTCKTFGESKLQSCAEFSDTYNWIRRPIACGKGVEWFASERRPPVAFKEAELDKPRYIKNSVE